MTDPKSFIEPFKSRLMEVFNASSSGDSNYRYPYQGDGQKRKRRPAAAGDMESESRHLFEDFLSLDEEKITHGLAKAKIRKAMDRKYRRSSQSEQLEQETRALEDVLDASEIDPEITRQKLVAIQHFQGELAELLQNRHPAIWGWVDLLSREAWLHLAQQGLPPRFLLNLMIISHYQRSGQEAYDNPQALLFLQLHVQYLNLGLSHQEILQQIEKYTLDLDDFQSLLNQTLHAIERNGEMINSLETLVQARCQQAQRYFLQKLKQPWLEPDHRLARYHIVARYRRLKQKLQEQAERVQAQQQVDAARLGGLLKDWHGQQSALLFLVLLRQAIKGLPLSEHELYQELQAEDLPELSPDMQNALNLRQLEAWIRQQQMPSANPLDPGFVPDSVLQQDLAQMMASHDWASLEKWALLKAYYGHLFQTQAIDQLGQQAEVFLPADFASK